MADENELFDFEEEGSDERLLALEIMDGRKCANTKNQYRLKKFQPFAWQLFLTPVMLWYSEKRTTPVIASWHQDRRPSSPISDHSVAQSRALWVSSLTLPFFALSCSDVLYDAIVCCCCDKLLAYDDVSLLCVHYTCMCYTHTSLLSALAILIQVTYCPIFTSNPLPFP